jgi:hypothetical protein
MGMQRVAIMKASLLLILIRLSFLEAAVGAAGEGPMHTIPEAARTLLEQAPELVVFSLDPRRPTRDASEKFHGWRVLGKTILKRDEPRRAALVEALDQGVKEYQGSGARCFNPRHGLRATIAGKTADFVICFECAQTHLFLTGEKEQVFLNSGSPAEAFDTVLRDAGVALPDRPEKRK